jgi:hypothetical protein
VAIRCHKPSVMSRFSSPAPAMRVLRIALRAGASSTAAGATRSKAFLPGAGVPDGQRHGQRCLVRHASPRGLPCMAGA